MIEAKAESGGERALRREYLSYEEARTLSGLSRTTLWRLINAQSGIKAARIGRTVRINRKSLEDFLERTSSQAEG
jgi:excisionase family DNA binding protein